MAWRIIAGQLRPEHINDIKSMTTIFPTLETEHEFSRSLHRPDRAIKVLFGINDNNPVFTQKWEDHFVSGTFLSLMLESASGLSNREKGWSAEKVQIHDKNIVVWYGFSDGATLIYQIDGDVDAEEAAFIGQALNLIRGNGNYTLPVQE